MLVELARSVIRIVAWLSLLLGTALFVLALLAVTPPPASAPVSTLSTGQAIALALGWFIGGVLTWGLLLIAVKASEDLEALTKPED